jgi:WD40 repeat protein
MPFRVLNAPHLKDDYYCSILAYCYTSHTLAVALTHKVYLWTEEDGVRYPPLPPSRSSNFVTSLAFSSEEGGKSILAIARHEGDVTLWSLFEQRPRFEAPHPCPASCVAFRPTTTMRKSLRNGKPVPCEDLIVGDDSGRIYLYSVDWPDFKPGSMTLLAKLNAHSQNICGLAWAPGGKTFVSGGNDNKALLFEVDSILQQAQNMRQMVHSLALPAGNPQGHSTAILEHGLATPPPSPQRPQRSASGLPPSMTSPPRISSSPIGSGINTPPATIKRTASRKALYEGHEAENILSNALANPAISGLPHLETFALAHAAAVKAVAFAPWQANLLATSGGSNDRQVHFYHTASGAALAVINVFAQVTSLVWSTTRRELAVTFGYAQPEHDIRVAVFSWPDCECVVRIPWERKPNGELGRALWAIPYPGGPNDAMPSRRQTGEGFAVWDAVRRREARRRRRDTQGEEGGQPAGPVDPAVDEAMSEEGPRGRSISRQQGSMRQQNASAPTSRRKRDERRRRAQSRAVSTARGEGEVWASRTEEEGSLIIACCDQTVKFFEVWTGKSKGNAGRKGLGSRPGVLGGSRILEGWCESIGELAGDRGRRGRWSEEIETIR